MYETIYETNEKHIDDRLLRQPTGRYHSLVSYLPREEIERVLNHFSQYIDSALYIYHDRDKKHTEDDMGVLLNKIKRYEAEVEKCHERIEALGTSKRDIEIAKKIDASCRTAMKKAHELKQQYHEWEIEKDDFKDPHWHILLKCFGAHTESAVRKYFYRFRIKETKIVDDVEQVMLVNTTNQLVDSVGEARDYLTHENDPDKYHYSKNDVIIYGRGWEAFQGAYRSIDSASEIVDRVMNNTSLRRLVKDYGKDFVYHYKQYAEMARAIHNQEMRAQNYVDLCEIAFKKNTDKIIVEDENNREIKVNARMYNQAVEIVTEFERDFQLMYQGD